MYYVRKIAIGVAVIGALAAVSVYANGLSAQDFVTKASIANQFEIDSSKLALDKAQNADVKSFAQTMVDDHTKTGEKLQKALESSNSNAKPAMALDDKHQKLLDKLQAKSGNDFDREYMSVQTDAHKEAVSLFTDYSKTGKDKPLKDFASQTLPTLKDHLTHVKDLKAEQ
jgi:putative membrane protein